MIRITLAAVCLAFGVLQINAQTNSFRTNIVLNVSVSLSALVQNISLLRSNNLLFSVGRPMKVDTKGVISSLSGLQTSITSSDTFTTNGSTIITNTIFTTNTLPTFGSNAKLLFQYTDVGTSTQSTGFLVRAGTNDTDISAYLQLFFSDSSTSVRNLRTNENRGTITETDYILSELRLQNTAKGDFAVQGFTTRPATTVVNNGQIIGSGTFPTAIIAQVAGQGHVGNQNAIFRGTVTAADRKIEIRPSP